MSKRSIWVHLLLLCLAPLLLSAAPGAAPPTSSNSQHHDNTLPPTTTATNSSPLNCTDLSDTTGATYSSCWDTLGMNQWMVSWNYTAKPCKPGEMWSTCFLRLAYGSGGYDCSRLGSLNCTAPQLGGPITDAQVFYGAYNIYGKCATHTLSLHQVIQKSKLTVLPLPSQQQTATSAPGKPPSTPSPPSPQSLNSP